MSASEKQATPAGADATGRDEEAVRIYASRIKHAALAMPAFIIMTLGIQAVASGVPFDAFHAGVIAIGGISGVILLYMGFDTKPVLVIDADGITCRRPRTGLIPWQAITGLGLGRAPIVRTVLLVAVDETAVVQDVKTRLKRQGFSLLNPTMARSQGQLAGMPTLQISVALLAVTPRQLQRLLEEKIHYHGPPD